MSRLYVQFLDWYHYGRAKKSHSEELIHQEARRAVRLASVVFDEIFVPASSYFESALARSVLDQHPLLAAAGYVRLTAGEPSLEEHRAVKLPQYDPSSPTRLHDAYSEPTVAPIGYVARPISTRSHIQTAWLRGLEAGDLRNLVDPTGTLGLSGSFELAWSRVPDELGDRAFVREHVWELFQRLSPGLPEGVLPYLDHTIERAYMDAYARFFDAAVLEDLVCLASPFPLPPAPQNQSYTSMIRVLARHAKLDRFDAMSEAELLASRDEYRLLLTPPEAGDSFVETLRSPTLPTATVAIMTTLNHELLAMRALLDDSFVKHFAGDSASYHVGKVSAFPPSRTSRTVVLVQTARMGTNAAAVATTRLLAHYPAVRDVIMVGIAGAIPRPDEEDKDVRLGDVVVSERSGVVSVDAVVRTSGGIRSRSMMPLPAANLLRATNTFITFGMPDDHIDACVTRIQAVNTGFERPPPEHDVLHLADGRSLEATRSEPKVFNGVIASSNSLVRDPVYRDLVGNETGAMALEMEAAGVVEAAWTENVGYLVVRGLVDYCDPWKNDVWHCYSAAAAAAVTHGVLVSLWSK